jgi:hypothetical protein
MEPTYANFRQTGCGLLCDSELNPSHTTTKRYAGISDGYYFSRTAWQVTTPPPLPLTRINVHGAEKVYCDTTEKAIGHLIASLTAGVWQILSGLTRSH